MADDDEGLSMVPRIRTRIGWVCDWHPIATKPPAREQSGIIVSDGVRRWFDHPGMKEALGNWLDGEPEPKWWFELPPLPNSTT